MADDQEPSNDAGDEGEVADYDTNDANDIIDTNDIITTTTSPAPIIDDAANTVDEDYADDEPLPDVTVKLYVNVNPDGPIIPNDLVNAGITDIYGNLIPQTATPWSDSINGYTGAITQGIYDELNGNTTDISGKRWWGIWTWNKALMVGLIGLCIIGIILALIFIIVGKKFKKNKRTPAAVTTSTTAGAGVVKGISPKSEYSPVPTSV